VGPQSSHAIMEHQGVSAKVNILCPVAYDKVIAPFFFMESTVSNTWFLNMLELLQVTFQQDGALPDWDLIIW
jgi:hypothetical protein